MPRRTETIVITDEGRDKGKTYIIHEMAASQAEWWAARAFLALARSGAEIPEDAVQGGMMGVARYGIRGLASLSPEEAKPLLDEMFALVSFVPDPARPMVVKGWGGVASLSEDDIEEVATRVKLRMALIALHLGFSVPVAP